jgi:adenosylcobinamide-GDP ribazoletransferase
MNSFLAALRFLTIIPVAGKQNAKVSVLTGFPLVGCLLGLLLATLAAVLLQFMSATVAAALTLLLWVVLTGALHIDAVGDSFDAL